MNQKGGEQIQESLSSLGNLDDGEGHESLQVHRLRCDFGTVYCPFMGHFSVWRAGHGMDSLSCDFTAASGEKHMQSLCWEDIHFNQAAGRSIEK